MNKLILIIAAIAIIASIIGFAVISQTGLFSLNVSPDNSQPSSSNQSGGGGSATPSASFQSPNPTGTGSTATPQGTATQSPSPSGGDISDFTASEHADCVSSTWKHC